MKRVSLMTLFVVATIWLAAVGVSAQVVELEFSGWEEALIGPIIERFNEEHDHIHVTFHPGDTEESILTRIAGGIAPDIYRVTWANFGLWVRQGLALDLTPLIERDIEEVDPADFWTPAYEAFQYEGRHFAMPHHVGGNLTYINVDRTEAAGMAVPDETWTWDDFTEIAARLSTDRDMDGIIDQYGFANATTHWLFWAGVIASNGGQILDQETMTFTIDNDTTIQALDFIYELVNVHHAAQHPDNAFAHDAHWVSGDAGMAMAPATTAWTDVDFNYKVLSNPRGSVTSVMPGGAQPLAIYPGTPHVEEAWTFIKWINRPDIQAWISNELGLYPPTRRSAIAHVDDPIIWTFGMNLENQYVYTTMLHNDLWNNFRDQINAMLRNERSSAAVAEMIQHVIDTRMAEVWD